MLSLGLIILALILSQTLKHFNSKLSKEMKSLKNFTFLVLNPIVMINSFWIIDFSNVTILLLPFICLIVLASTGCLGLFIAKKLKYTREEQASMFSSSSFSNLGTIGGLVTFVFLGQEAFAMAAMYILLESVYNYIIAYPVVKTIGDGEKMSSVERLKSIIKDPTIMIYQSTIVFGLILNFSPISRPAFMTSYNDIMIPVISFLLIFSIGYTMDFGKMKSRVSSAYIVLAIKYLVAPTIAMIFAFTCFSDPMIRKVLLLMSLAPCGFNSIFVPTIYKADHNIASASWVLTTAALVVIIPLEYLVVTLL